MILNPSDNAHALDEAARMHIPVIGLVDSDTLFHGIEYRIPANDDGERRIYGVLAKLAQVCVRAE